MAVLVCAVGAGCSSGSARSTGSSTGAANSPGTGGTGMANSGPGGSGASTPPGPMGGVGNTFIDQVSTALVRLTNTEYSQTVTDLVGEPPNAAARYQFPDDSQEHGFDNNVALLHVSPVHADKYATAAETIAAATFAAPDRRARVLTCDPATGGAACLNTFVRAMGRRAFRHVLSDAEVNPLIALATAAASMTDPTSGPKIALTAMLQAPAFLYRVQVGVADPSRPGIVGLDGFEMATRLSYFLFGTTPDDALLDKAAAGSLSTPDGVKGIVQQMLTDPRSRLGIKRFYSQWLPLSLISGPTAQADRLPHGDPVLATTMAEETSRFVDNVLWNGGTVLDLLTAPYTFVEATLAKNYGMPAVTGWTRVDFPAGSPRLGILTQGTFLAAGSHGTRPSNTRRGQMVREQLLCQTIPPPPPGVNAVIPNPMPGETERQTFARHTTDAACAGCHVRMDPIGFGLSGFDEIGAVRTVDTNGQPISVAGSITGMMPPDFNGPVELAKKVAASPEYRACFATELFRYVFARTEAAQDTIGITELQGGFESAKWDFGKGVSSLVLSDGFRYRNKGDAP
jgi:Protein of unknown function (DUF1592)/Protein of unknown function (DUF1588)/Protein of unknown function (DUF1587)/Protein of unknown function (DUF1595)